MKKDDSKDLRGLTEAAAFLEGDREGFIVHEALDASDAATSPNATTSIHAPSNNGSKAVAALNEAPKCTSG